MSARSRVIAVATVAMILFAASTASAEKPIGELVVGAGIAVPSGNYQTYADNGLRLYGRITPRLPFLRVAGGWLDLDWVLFSEDRDEIGFEVGGFQRTAERKIGEYAFSMHLGVQLGSDTRRGFIRPRVGAGIGFYSFWTNTSIQLPGSEDKIVDENIGQLRGGWRGIAGVDFFWSRKYGVAIEFLYDQVWNFRREVQFEEGGPVYVAHRSARFWGINVAAVIALEMM